MNSGDKVFKKAHLVDKLLNWKIFSKHIKCQRVAIVSQIIKINTLIFRVLTEYLNSRYTLENKQSGNF